MRRFLLLLMIVVLPTIAQLLTWTQHTPGSSPAYAGFNSLEYDPVAQKLWVYALRNTTQIGFYSTDMSYVNVSGATPSWTLQAGGTGSHDTVPDGCNTYPDTSVRPADHHPYRQVAMDTRRGLLWMLNGASSNCANPETRWGYEVLHANPDSNTWTWLTPASYTGIRYQGQLVYMAAYDVLVAFGPDSGGRMKHYFYCPTVPVGGGSPSGTLSAQQTEAGCDAGSTDEWEEFVPAGNTPATVFGCDGSGCFMTYAPAGIYIPARQKIFAYGGLNQFTISTQTWEFDIVTKTWTQLCQGGCVAPPDQNSDVPVVAYDSRRNRVWLHHVVAAGTPATDYYYDFASDAWINAGQIGGPTTKFTIMGYDTVYDKLVTFGQLNSGAAAADVWVADISTLGGSRTTGTVRLLGGAGTR